MKSHKLYKFIQERKYRNDRRRSSWVGVQNRFSIGHRTSIGRRESSSPILILSCPPSQPCPHDGWQALGVKQYFGFRRIGFCNKSAGIASRGRPPSISFAQGRDAELDRFRGLEVRRRSRASHCHSCHYLMVKIRIFGMDLGQQAITGGFKGLESKKQQRALGPMGIKGNLSSFFMASMSRAQARVSSHLQKSLRLTSEQR